MKVFKKIAAAVSMAAVCCTMINPMTASASNECPGHYYVTQPEITSMEIASVEYFTHEYAANWHENLNGDLVPDILECRVELIRCYHDEVCSLCGATNPKVEFTYKIRHVNCEFSSEGLMDL